MSTNRIVILLTLSVLLLSFNKYNVSDRSFCKGQTVIRCAWHKASDDNYQAYKVLLDTKLNAIEQDLNLLYCHDNSCKCVDHRNSIDVLCNSIIECCLCASASTIPQT